MLGRSNAVCAIAGVENVRDSPHHSLGSLKFTTTGLAYCLLFLIFCVIVVSRGHLNVKSVSIKSNLVGGWRAASIVGNISTRLDKYQNSTGIKLLLTYLFFTPAHHTFIACSHTFCFELLTDL